MEPSWTLGSVTCQRQAVIPHDAIHEFVIDTGLVLLGKLASKPCRDAVITVGRPPIDHAANHWPQLRDLRFVVAPTRLGVYLQTGVQLKARDAECLRDAPHRVTSLSGASLNKVGSFSPDHSSASWRIRNLASAMVLRPSGR